MTEYSRYSSSSSTSSVPAPLSSRLKSENLSPVSSPSVFQPSSPFMSSQGSGVFDGNRPQSPTALTANAKRHKYMRRILKFRQMDFEYALWQMLYLFISPQKVYRNFGYRKQTKDQWARDDPAFLVLLTFWLCASSIGFAVVLSLSFFAFVKFLLWVVFIDCIGVGILLATGFWFLTNRYLIIQPPRGQDVEWGYCFDIHLNAFFPLLMILHFFQLPLLNHFINRDMYVSCLFGNTLWLIGVSYYIYITFLGYSCKIPRFYAHSSSTLAFLKRTRILLYPFTVVFLFYIISIVIGWNFSRTLCHFYEFRAA